MKNEHAIFQRHNPFTADKDDLDLPSLMEVVKQTGGTG